MNKKKKSLKQMLIRQSVIPAVFVGAVLTIIAAEALFTGMTNEIRNSLSVAAHSVYNTYSIAAPGDLRLKDGLLVKGDMLIDGDYYIVDSLKKSYGMEITLFYGDERKLTTITDENGERVTGTKAADEASHWVLENGHEYFSQKVEIDGEDYFGYYVPIFNEDKTVAGMAFAGKKRAEVMNSVRTIMFQSVAVCVVAILATLLFSVAASQKMIQSLHSIMEYLGYIAKSDFSKKMPQSVVQRKDEIGDMGRYAETVSKSLKDMITTDPLTGLYNRRACKNYLEKKIAGCNREGKNSLAVAIGDIDYFKKINDTYGHDCGDMVLIKISEIFEEKMKGIGSVARWGGEEFLLVFEQDIESAGKRLGEILEEIRSMDFEYGNQHFGVTLTFGISGDIAGHSFDEIIKEADNRLYKGKEGGRNRIITSDGNIILPDVK